MAKQNRTDSTPGPKPTDLEEAFAKLQPFLQVGYSFHKACIMALIPYTTLRFYYNEDEEFRNKIERERNLVNVVARRNIIKTINEGKVGISLEWLDRMEKDEFSKRTELTGPGGEALGGSLNDPRVLNTVLKAYDIVNKRVRKLSNEKTIQDSTSK